jgi:hypothetical protein
MKNDYPSRWVRAGKYEHIAGMTAEAVSIARRKGKLVDGKQVKLGPDGNLWVNVPEMDQWVETAGKSNAHAA